MPLLDRSFDILLPVGLVGGVDESRMSASPLPEEDADLCLNLDQADEILLLL